MRKKDKIELEKKLTPTEKCMKKRKVTQCVDCCRCDYCWGFEEHPYTDKAVDLWLENKRSF